MLNMSGGTMNSEKSLISKFTFFKSGVCSLRNLIGFKSNFEAKKFIAISITKFLTVYIFAVLRGLEYSMLVPLLGAEVISAVELYCLLPASLLFVIFYFKVGKHYSRIKIASAILIAFVTFYYLFNLFLFPNHDSLAIDLSSMKDAYPRIKYPLMLIENWDITLFYVFAELWGIMMLSLSFWQLANEVNTVEEAKKFYGFFGAIGQTGLIVGGWAAVMISDIYPSSLENVWQLRVNWLINSITLAGIVLLASYWWIAKNIWPYVRMSERKFAKVKLTLKDSFKYILASKYLRLVATLIICYGVLMSISETLWKDQVARLYTNAADYSQFIGMFQMYLGYGTVFGMLAAVASLRRFSWLFNALTTPISFLVAGVFFFLLVIFREEFQPLFAYLGMTVIFAAVMTGMMQILLTKSFKYSLFDLSKEMTFIPLDEELRTNGKAAVDIISNRLGRSGGSIIMLALLTAMPGATLVSLSGILFVIFLIVLGLWFHAVFALNKEFTALMKKNATVGVKS
jgi:ATP:ADP antiporter, AAA family